MPNGFYGSKKEWDRMEAPLKELDPVLQEYASEHNLYIEKNYHNWPSCSLKWSDKDIERTIEISLGTGKKLLFSFWLAASRDVEGKRYWKNHFLKKDVPITEIKTGIKELLDHARTTERERGQVYTFDKFRPLPIY